MRIPEGVPARIVEVVFKLLVELQHRGRVRLEVYHGWILAAGQQMVVGDVLRITLQAVGVVQLEDAEGAEDAWDLSHGVLIPGPSWDEAWDHFSADVMDAQQRGGGPEEHVLEVMPCPEECAGAVDVWGVAEIYGEPKRTDSCWRCNGYGVVQHDGALEVPRILLRTTEDISGEINGGGSR